MLVYYFQRLLTMVGIKVLKTVQILLKLSWKMSSLFEKPGKWPWTTEQRLKWLGNGAKCSKMGAKHCEMPQNEGKIPQNRCDTGAKCCEMGTICDRTGEQHWQIVADSQKWQERVRNNETSRSD